MLCRTVPIAKGNIEKVAMARFTRLQTWIAWCPEAIGQGAQVGCRRQMPAETGPLTCGMLVLLEHCSQLTACYPRLVGKDQSM